MKRQPWLLAGTALALLMAAPLGASPISGNGKPTAAMRELLPLILAQEEAPPAEEVIPEAQPEPEAAPEAAPEPEATPEPEAAPEPAPEPEIAPEPEAAPAPEPEAAPEPAPEPEAAPEPQPEAAPEPDPGATPQPEPSPDAPPEAPVITPDEPPADAPPADTPSIEQPVEPAQPVQPTEPAPAAPAVEPTEPVSPVEPVQPSTEAPATGEQPAAPAPAETPSTDAPAPADGAAAPAPAAAPAVAQPPVALPPGEEPSAGAAQTLTEGEQPAQAAPAAPAGPPPQDDAAAQQQQPTEIQSVTAEQGTRREKGASPADEPRRRDRPEGVDVVREVGDRVILEINNQVIVESNDQPRLTQGAREVYYEDLPRGRTREVVIRENGVQVVTVRNQYGDIVRRSRIAPDGEESVLLYVDDEDYERLRDWRDPGLDLPPLQLTIPADEYILDADEVEEEEAYYDFLDQPPVERVERLYSVDEVKRSSRIRQKTRRVDLDTVTFEFGSAAVPESQVSKLEGVAGAIEKLLQKNPAETFLIEGHTDAVGSDVANLALSDRRAEAVAEALTSVFAIPPENLATQGYGEQYLKVKSETPEQQNRRVSIRRITALVAPARTASAQ